MHSSIGQCEEDKSSTIDNVDKQMLASQSSGDVYLNESNITTYMGQTFGSYNEAKEDYFRYTTRIGL